MCICTFLKFASFDLTYIRRSGQPKFQPFMMSTLSYLWWVLFWHIHNCKMFEATCSCCLAKEYFFGYMKIVIYTVSWKFSSSKILSYILGFTALEMNKLICTAFKTGNLWLKQLKLGTWLNQSFHHELTRCSAYLVWTSYQGKNNGNKLHIVKRCT